MNDVTAIILAAGLSRRMGERNKLLLPINGIPMIRHMVNTYAAVTTRPVVVVTGHEAPAIEAALVGLPVVTVFNADYEQGQSTTVACGLRAVRGDTTILIGLGDQPLLTQDDLRRLIDAHRAADGSRISIPMVDQQRGNPIVIPADLHARVLADPHAPGCKKFTRAYPEHVRFHPLAARGYYADVDTPDAYTSFITSHQRNAE